MFHCLHESKDAKHIMAKTQTTTKLSPRHQTSSIGPQLAPVSSIHSTPYPFGHLPLYRWYRYKTGTICIAGHCLGWEVPARSQVASYAGRVVAVTVHATAIFILLRPQRVSYAISQNVVLF